jgi:methionyl-tRNA formyltransferase
MKTYVLLSSKSWHDSLFENLKNRETEDWLRISTKDDFNIQHLRLISPEKIFIAHWSYIIPREIYTQFECVLFHMTDLPYGRGGSPLQNLIIRGHKSTMISAIRVNKGIDTGDIYLKKPLDLSGTAQDIFIRSIPVVFTMIKEILDNSILPSRQKGDPTVFKRRKPHESDISDLFNLSDLYDYIRMLDAPGYPKAFLETNHFRLEFMDAHYQDKLEIIANVRIVKK